MKHYLLLLVGALSHAVAWSKPSVSEIQIADEFASYVVSVQLLGSPTYYGTGWLPSWDHARKRIYVTVPYHVLPKSPEKWVALRLQSPLLGKGRFEAKVVAIAPDQDLAVLVWEAGQLSDHQQSALSQTIEKIRARIAPPHSDTRVVHAAVVAVPGRWTEEESENPAILFENTDWYHKTTSEKKDAPVPFDTGRTGISVPGFSAKTRMQSLPFCPQPFLSGCYEIDAYTVGHSGGLFLTSHTQRPFGALDKGIRIKGMVTHFSPWPAISYVVPATQIIELTDHFIAQWKQTERLHVETHDALDDRPVFEWISENAARVLRGPHTGKIEEGASLSSGSGDPSGGGQNPGFASNGTFHFRNDIHGHLSGWVAWPDLIRSLRDPASWHLDKTPMAALFNTFTSFRGGRQTLSYAPGIRLSGNGYDSYDGEPIESLSDFVQKYRLNPYETYLDVIENLPAFIEEVYNGNGIHQRLDYLTPIEVEDLAKSGKLDGRFDLEI